MILILDSPEQLSPVNNGLYYTINSTDKGQPLYKFGINVFEKSISDTSFTKITELFYSPTPSGISSTTVINVGSILEPYIETLVPSIDPITTIFANRNNVRDFYIEFKGYSGLTSTMFETATGSTTQYFNGVITSDQYPSYNSNDYIFTTGGTTSKFFTNKPTTLCREPYNWLYYYASGNTTTNLDIRSITRYDQWVNENILFEPFDWENVGNGVYEIVAPNNSLTFDTPLLATDNLTFFQSGVNTYVYHRFQNNVGDRLNINANFEFELDIFDTPNPELSIWGRRVSDNNWIKIGVINYSLFSGITYRTSATSFTLTNIYSNYAIRFEDFIQSPSPDPSVIRVELNSLFATVQTSQLRMGISNNNILRDTYPIATGRTSGLFSYGDAKELKYSVLPSYSVAMYRLTQNPITSATPTGITATFTPLSDTYNYTECRDCLSDLQNITLVWENALGGYDTKTFIAKIGEQLQIERGLFDRQLSNPYNSQTRGREQYYRKVQKTMTVVSDFLDKQNVKWLSEIVYSNNVFIVNGSELISVTVNNDSVTQKVKEANTLYQLALELSYAKDLI